MFSSSVFLVLIPALVAIGVLRIAADGCRSLRQTPAASRKAGLDGPAADALAGRVARLRRYRWGGGLAGLLAVAVVLLPITHSLTLNFQALLAGVIGGALLAEWQVSRSDRRRVRSASLRRRRLPELAGPTLLTMAITGAALGLVSRVLYGIRLAQKGHIRTVNWLPGSCHELTSAPSSVLRTMAGSAGPLALVAAGTAVALAAARRAENPDLPGELDRELRRATIRLGLGAPALLGWLAAAVNISALANEFSLTCSGLAYGWRTASILIALGCGLCALLCLVRYLLRPVRLATLQSALPVG